MTEVNGTCLYGDHGIMDDVMQVIYSYCDIPSLFKLSRTCRDGYEQTMNDDSQWKRLAKLRFLATSGNISSKWMSWRERYRQWSICQRPPIPMRRSIMKVTDGFSHHGLALWMTVKHTDNCETKPFSNQIRCIEFKLILQMVQSHRKPCTIHYHDIHLLMLNEVGQAYLLPTISNSNKSLNAESKCNHLLRNKFNPKILYHSENQNEFSDTFILKPFQVAVLSMHIPTHVWMETDFLAQALEIHIPISTNNDYDTKRYIAPIISESKMWEYYQELPGGCLSLLSSTNAMIHA